MLTNLISFLKMTLLHAVNESLTYLLTYLSYFHILSIPIRTTVQNYIRDEYESAIQ